MIRQAVVLCGGPGTRLGHLVADVPKPMLSIAGRPVLEHAIDRLRAAGVDDLVLAAGHKADVIRRHFAAPRPGLRIRVFEDPQPLGTAGCVRRLLAELDERFVLLYGDVFVDFDIGELVRADRPEARATLLVRPSDHPWDSDLVVVDDSGRVTGFLPAAAERLHARNVANTAVAAVDRELVRLLPPDRKADWVRDAYPRALEAGMLIRAHLFSGDGFLRDMGTPERLDRVRRHVEEREWISAARAGRRPIRTVFLDRDGVINEEVDLLRSITDFRLLTGVGPAIARLNAAGLRVIVVTNQPAIARGLCTEADLAAIHDRMARLLAEEGARVDAVYHCPHHPETYHPEPSSRLDLRIACECRKPAPGMLLRAVREHGVDLAAAVLVGDRSSDIVAARRAGIRGILVGDAACDPRPDHRRRDLPEAVAAILAGEIP